MFPSCQFFGFPILWEYRHVQHGPPKEHKHKGTERTSTGTCASRWCTSPEEPRSEESSSMRSRPGSKDDSRPWGRPSSLPPLAPPALLAGCCLKAHCCVPPVLLSGHPAASQSCIAALTRPLAAVGVICVPHAVRMLVAALGRFSHRCDLASLPRRKKGTIRSRKCKLWAQFKAA